MLQSCRSGALAALPRRVPAVWRCVVTTSRRGYHYPYAADMVPAGATTSRFQSSVLPSVRDRVVREYALAPLLAARTPCCVLGFACGAREVLPRKAALRAALATLFDCGVDDVRLGMLQQLKEMMLHRRGTDESPRLGDDAFARPDWQERRRSRYGRMPVVAQTLLPVYLSDALVARSDVDETSASPQHRGSDDNDDDSTASDDSDVALRALRAYGELVRDALYDVMLTRTHASLSSSLLPSKSLSDDAVTTSVTQPGADAAGVTAQASDDADEATATQRALARVRVQASLLCRLGVVYCELPPVDVSDAVFDTLQGVRVDADEADAVASRWHQHVQSS